MNTKMGYTKYDVGNPSPDLGQSGGDKPFIGSQPFPLDDNWISNVKSLVERDNVYGIYRIHYDIRGLSRFCLIPVHFFHLHYNNDFT